MHFIKLILIYQLNVNHSTLILVAQWLIFATFHISQVVFENESFLMTFMQFSLYEVYLRVTYMFYTSTTYMYPNWLFVVQWKLALKWS